MRSIEKNKVLVGLSGGADSAAAALLLKQEGYHVEGAYLHLRDRDVQMHGAEEMAECLRIPLHILDCRKYFEEEIIGYFIDSYHKGETPNPCIPCNKKVKFGKMLDYALERGFGYIATGHYARIVHDGSASSIFRAVDRNKDQSYLLYTLSEYQRKHVLFPLGEMPSKEMSRQILKENNIHSCYSDESQEICFVEDDYREFLKERGYTPQKGRFIDESGNVLGDHKGIGYYTVGQRRGLGISASEPLFVKEIRKYSGDIVLSTAASLMHSVVVADEIHFFDDIPADKIDAKIRYSAPAVPCVLSFEEDSLRVAFEKPVRAATPGQSIVFYREDRLLGGGIIR